MAKLTKTSAKKMLADVPAEKRFWCADGRVFRNLAELEAALKGMSEATFRHHCNEAKSDFAVWVKDVIGDEKLARDLGKCTSSAVAAGAVAARIAFLQEK